MKFRPGTHRVLSGILVALVLAAALAVPAAATTPLAGKRGNYRGQCRQLTKQIDHYKGTIRPLAISRRNPKWERATTEQIERLWNRRADLCPAYGSERTLIAKTIDQIRRFNQMIIAAGRAAATYFSGGLSGGVGP
jgi:hypothetical protein